MPNSAQWNSKINLKFRCWNDNTNDISIKSLKQNSCFFSNFFHKNVSQRIFISNLKRAGVNPCYKNNISKENYRPISILPNVSKVHERCTYSQMQQYFDNILSKYQCNFCKGFNSLHCLIKKNRKMAWKCR